MDKEQKSSAMSQKNEAKIELFEALDKLGVVGTKRFAASKKFKGSEPKTEKEWRKFFSEKRILGK